MRALADAVVVGVNTVLLDDPQLTVRRCAGANPLRVVIDPERRLDGSQRIFRDEAAPTLVLAAADRARAGEALGQAEVVPVPRGEWGLDPHEIRRILARRGLTWLFIEGGGITVSRFLAAGALDRLQITVVPAHPRFGTAEHPVAGDRRSHQQSAAAHPPLRPGGRHHGRM